MSSTRVHGSTPTNDGSGMNKNIQPANNGEN